MTRGGRVVKNLEIWGDVIYGWSPRYSSNFDSYSIFFISKPMILAPFLFHKRTWYLEFPVLNRISLELFLGFPLILSGSQISFLFTYFWQPIVVVIVIWIFLVDTGVIYEGYLEFPPKVSQGAALWVLSVFLWISFVLFIYIAYISWSFTFFSGNLWS